MGRSGTDLVLYKKAEVLLNEIYPILVHFPKSEKFALCQEIKQAFYALLRCSILANNLKHKRRMYQEEADGYIKLLLILFGIAKTQKYLSQKKHLYMQTRLAELGRILGGWMKS